MIRKLNRVLLVLGLAGAMIAGTTGCETSGNRGDGFRWGNFNQRLDDLEYNPNRTHRQTFQESSSLYDWFTSWW